MFLPDPLLLDLILSILLSVLASLQYDFLYFLVLLTFRLKSFGILNLFSKSRSLVIDHNHTTLQLRGLLCNSCNRALGLFGDNSEITDKATKYLKKWNTIYDTTKCH